MPNVIVGNYLHRVGREIVLTLLTNKKIPRIGSRVYDRQRKEVGVVVDVIGPVKSPYVVVRGKVVNEYFIKEKDLIEVVK